MTAIPFPLTSSPGAHAQESAGRLVNCYAEPLGKEARWPARYARTPGLTQFGTSGGTGYRGGHVLGATFYAAWNNRVERYTSAGGTGTVVGTLNGTAKMSWARNNRTTPDLVAVSPGEGAFFVSSSGVSSLSDADLPSPTDVAFVRGFFIFAIADARMFASGLNTITVNGNDFATAESKPDTLYRVVPLGTGSFLASGSTSMEVWGGEANLTGFPFSYVTTIPKGLIARDAIAGYQDGFGSPIVFVGDDNAVHMLNGYTPEKISPPDLDRLIEALTDKTTLEASVYTSNGRKVFVLSCPAWTWEFNFNSLKWNERASHLQNRWRGTQAHNAFGRWVVGDTQSGTLYAIDADAKTEGGNPLRMRIESGPVHKFPQRTRIARADFDFTMGVGIATGADPIEVAPRASIAWSDDGGVSWGVPLLRELGRQGKAGNRVTLLRMGMAGPQGRRWRVDVSDPVPVTFLSGDQATELRSK